MRKNQDPAPREIIIAASEKNADVSIGQWHGMGTMHARALHGLSVWQTGNIGDLFPLPATAVHANFPDR